MTKKKEPVVKTDQSRLVWPSLNLDGEANWSSRSLFLFDHWMKGGIAGFLLFLQWTRVIGRKLFCLCLLFRLAGAEILGQTGMDRKRKE